MGGGVRAKFTVLHHISMSLLAVKALLYLIIVFVGRLLDYLTACYSI